MRTDALYSACCEADTLYRHLDAMRSILHPNADFEYRKTQSSKALYRLAVALGYHLTPASQPVTIEHEPTGGLTR
jgi:hypothetical protein